MLDHHPNFGNLERNWRRVASTHTLQALINADAAPVVKPRWRLVILGAVLIMAGIATLVAGIFSIVVARLLPPSTNEVLRAIQEDRYYHLLIPLTVPVTIIAIFFNWFSMKLFKHNS